MVETITLSYIEFKINVDEIDRAITEIEGGLDRMIDSVNKLGEK